MRSLAVSVVTLAFLSLWGCGSSSTDNHNVTTTPGAPDAAHSTLTADRTSSVVADGLDRATLTVTVKDASGQPLADQVVQLSATGSGNTLSTPAKTDTSGQTTATLSSTVAEAKTITATVGAATLSPVTITFAPGVASQLSFAVPPSNVPAGATMNPAVQVQILDAHGNRVNSTATVQLTLGNNSAGATLTGTVSRAAVGGVATFNDLSLDRAASGYTLVASSTGVPNATSRAFDVTFGANQQLVFASQPTNVKSMTAFSPVVQVEIKDGSGNLVTTSSAPVTMALAGGDSAAKLSGTVTVNAVSGVATFSDLMVDKAATGYQLAATSSGFAGATSTSFDVSPGTISQIAFVQQPSDVNAGSPVSPAVTVAVEDSAGNVASSTRTITMKILTNPGNATLTGTTSVKAVNGIATFSNLLLDKSGTGYVLKATDSSSHSATSNPFNVIAGPITGVEVTHFLSDTGAVLTDVPKDLSKVTIAAHVELADGGFQTFAGTGNADGTFSILNVPTTGYVLERGGLYYASSTRSWNLQSYAGGRPDVVYPDAGTTDAGTTLAFDVSGMSPWNDADDLQMFSLGATAYVDAIPAYSADPMPTAGDTAWKGSIAYNPWNSGLVDASKGDSVRVTQLHAQTTDGGLIYAAAANSVAVSNVTLVNGQSNPVTVTLSPLAQTASATLALDFPSFENAMGGVIDGGSFQGDAFYLSELPVADHGAYSVSADVATFSLYDAGTPAQTANLQYGLVEPSWSQFVFLSTSVTGPAMSLPLPDGGTSNPTHGWGYLIYQDTLANAQTAGVHLPVSPVQQLTINGSDATTQPLTGVGTNPVVSWTAPAVGTPTYYSIRVRELVLNGTRTRYGSNTSVKTTGTSIRLPPGMLQPGHSYFLTVSAVVDPSVDVTSAPFLGGFPYHSADALTQMVTP